MVSDGLTQGGNALIGQGQQQFFTVVQHHFPLQAAPYGEGEFFRAAAGQIQQGRCHGGGYFPGRKGSVGKGMGNILHKKTDLFLGADIAFAEKLTVGSFHGDFADFQILCQCPLGGQFLSGC